VRRRKILLTITGETVMNIFILDRNPVLAAKMQCDKHVVKMVLESGQMLSTAHRLLDGDDCIAPDKLYKVAHAKHPCTIWTMESNNNYNWHYVHFCALCEEYKYRYGKTHMTDTKLRDVLKTPPKNIPVGYLTKHPLAMKSNPECMHPNDPVRSYREYYKTKEKNFKMVWTKRETPNWFLTNYGG
jgi:hypothetical protein